MSEQEETLVTAIKRHITICVAIVVVLFMIVNLYSVKCLLERIETVRCHCSNMKVEANNSGINISQRRDSAEELAREILQKQGAIKHDMRGIKQPENGLSSNGIR